MAEENTGGSRENTDAVPPCTPNAGENLCRRCGGSGAIGGSDCPDCKGTGKVLTPVGGAG